MNWAQRRRTIIILILLGCFLVFVFIPYKVAHYEAPTCSDGKQNQTEEGTDCGGPCQLLCAGKVAELKILWTKIFAVRDGVYDIVSYVENPNLNATAKTIPYTVRLFDSADRVIAERRGETFARPSERFAVFEGGMVTGGKVPARGEIVFQNDFKWFSVTVPNLDIRIVDKQLSNAQKSPRLTANIINEGESDLRNIYLTAIIYDQNNSAIGVSATKVEKLSNNERAKLSFTWSKPFSYAAEYESCEQPVDVVLALDRSGSMSSDRRDPPEPLTQAKQAAAKFIERMTSGRDQVAFVSFATEATNPIDEPFTAKFDSVSSSILNTSIQKGSLQYTNIGDAFLRAQEELATQRRNSDAKAVVVLLTDGAPTYPKDQNNPKYPEEYARQTAEQLKNSGVSIYTIGLGNDVNQELLQQLATKPDQYYAAATGAELADVYQTIASAICEKTPSVIEILPRINNVPDSISTY